MGREKESLNGHCVPARHAFTVPSECVTVGKEFSIKDF